MMMIRLALVLAGFVALAFYALDDSDAMAKCQVNHSYGVCVQSLR